jgi:hypothetical protein
MRTEEEEEDAAIDEQQRLRFHLLQLYDVENTVRA